MTVAVPIVVAVGTFFFRAPLSDSVAVSVGAFKTSVPSAVGRVTFGLSNDPLIVL